MKNKIKLIILLTITLLSVSCAVQNNPRNPKMANTEVTTVPKILDESLKEDTKKDAPAIDMKNCVCVQMWMPVCGENGKTYSNSCFANCAKVKFKPGSCTKSL